MIAPNGKTSSASLNIAYSLADQNFAQTKSVGILNVAVGLAQALSRAPEVERLVLFTNSTLNLASSNFVGSCVTEQMDLPIRNTIGRIFWDQWAVYSAAQRAQVDWLVLPKGFASFVRKPRVKIASYVHDVIHEFYKAKYPGQIGGRESDYFLRSLRATVQHSKVICTNSEFSRSEVLRFAERHRLTCPPVVSVGIGFTREQGPSVDKENSVLVLAGRFLHKRTALAVEFMTRWQTSTQFAGKVHWVGGLPDGVVLPPHSNWIRHPRLPDPEYKRLMQTSRVLVYFSEYEGFGMPPVEATLAGACPVFSNIPAMMETMGETGFPFSNESYDGFAQALDRALRVDGAQVDGWAATLLNRHNWDLVTRRFVGALIQGGRRGT